MDNNNDDEWKQVNISFSRIQWNECVELNNVFNTKQQKKHIFSNEK